MSEMRLSTMTLMAVGPLSHKSTLQNSIVLGFKTLAISTYSHKNPSILNEHLTFCSKKIPL